MLTTPDYLICLFGWVLYNFFLFNKAKNKADAAKEEFNLSSYAKTEWDDWVMTFGASFGLLIMSPYIFFYLDQHYDWMKNVFWSPVIPFAVGVFGGLAFQKMIDIGKSYMDRFKRKVDEK